MNLVLSFELHSLDRLPEIMIFALTGFMGSGKSTVGRAMARMMCCRFKDLDEEIELRTGHGVKEIFACAGETGFRDIESATLEELLDNERGEADLVIALGGGTLTRMKTRLSIRRNCRCIYLRASSETLKKRLEADSCFRPMLEKCPFDGLLSRRIPYYEEIADIILDTDSLTADETASSLISIVHNVF